MSAITPFPLLVGTPPCHALSFRPAGTARGSALLVPPLFEEQRCAHRALFVAAMALATAGVHVLVVHPRGTGNSAGRLTDITLTDWRDDLQAAAAFLADHPRPLTVIGVRAGALLAAGLTADRLLLVQPVTRGKEYLRQTRTRRAIQDKLTGEAAQSDPREIEGQLLAEQLLADLEAAVLPDAPPVPDTRLLQCSFNEKIHKEFEDLQARWQVPLRPLVQEPFWLPHTPGYYTALQAALVEEVLA